jgi:hypothetical protein
MAKIRIKKQSYVFDFMQHVIEQLQQLGRIRCSESYTATLNSFKRFRNQKDVLLSEMDSEMMQAYEAYLKEFVHAVDDFTKGIKIDQDDETYRNLKVERVNLPKQPYMIIDIANPYINLTNKIGEAYLSELKKFKKIILKTLEAK